MRSLKRLARARHVALLFCATVWLSGCSVLDKPTRSVVFDFGPAATLAEMPVSAPPRPAIALAEVEASSALDSTAVLYRLAYADAQQLQPYAQARWSMPPAQLLRQRLRQSLVQSTRVTREGDVAAQRPLILRIELDEFSQMFDAPGRSVGQVRVHATVLQASASGERLVAQRGFVAQRPAPSADAAGGVRALTAATDAVVADIVQWTSDLK